MNFSLFLLCKKCPASGFVYPNALTMHYFFFFKHYCFPLDIVLLMFWQNVSCYPDDKSTVCKCRVDVFRLWNAFKLILPYHPLELLINVFNQTFELTKQFDKSNNFPILFFLICSHRSLNKRKTIYTKIKTYSWININKNIFIHAVST